jgi:hypothetical protein
MTKKMKWSNYFKPTPKRLRILGDSFAVASTFTATLSIVTDHQWLAVFIIISGWTGKFITNFFAEEEKTD